MKNEKEDPQHDIYLSAGRVERRLLKSGYDDDDTASDFLVL